MHYTDIKNNELIELEDLCNTLTLHFLLTWLKCSYK